MNNYKSVPYAHNPLPPSDAVRKQKKVPSRNNRAGNRLGGGWRAGRVAGDRLTLAGLQTPRCDGWLGQPAGASQSASLLDTGWCQPRPSHPTA